MEISSSSSEEEAATENTKIITCNLRKRAVSLVNSHNFFLLELAAAASTNISSSFRDDAVVCFHKFSACPRNPLLFSSLFFFFFPFSPFLHRVNRYECLSPPIHKTKPNSSTIKNGNADRDYMASNPLAGVPSAPFGGSLGALAISMAVAAAGTAAGPVR